MLFLAFCLVLLVALGAAMYFGLASTAKDETREPWEPGYRGGE